MPLSLHDATIPPFLRLLQSTSGLLDKAQAHCAEHGLAEEAILQAAFADDMLPFGYQVKSIVAHSAGAIAGVRGGIFAADLTPFEGSLGDLAAMVTSAGDMLAALDPVEIEGFQGRPVRFVIRAWHCDYVAEDFLLSFSKPNFYFHVSTAYGLLRANGVKIGKLDYLGPMALQKTSQSA